VGFVEDEVEAAADSVPFDWGGFRISTNSGDISINRLLSVGDDRP